MPIGDCGLMIGVTKFNRQSKIVNPQSSSPSPRVRFAHVGPLPRWGEGNHRRIQRFGDTLVVWAAVQLVLAAYAGCQEAATMAGSPLPSGDTGIASKYLGDSGIEKDPAVLFADGFEDCSKPADLNRKWSGVFGDHSMRITEEAANIYGGRKALEIAMPRQETPQSSGLQKVLKDEYDVLFLRFYSKFEKEFDYPKEVSCHNGGDISAHYYMHGATPGQRADGRNKFLVAYEDEVGYRDKAPVPGPLNVYCYHPEQRDNYGDHFNPTGSVMPFSPQLGNKGNFGKDFVSRPDVVPELDRWYCFEFMVTANTVGQRDGRIACWLDGKLIADFTNMRFRDVETLKMERIGIGIYMARNALRENKKWYDDVVVATSYIGPMVKEKKAPPKLETAKVAAPVEVKPAAPKIEAQALAPWDEKLAARVAQGLRKGQRPTASMKVMGAKEEPVKVVGTDGKSLSVEIQGGALPLPWSRLSTGDRLSLARAFLKEGVPEDHILVAVFALADGRAELSDEHFAKAKVADPKGGEARVAEVRASLGLK